MKNDDLLISQLINETCKDEREDLSSNVVDLSSYFEKRLNQVEHKSLNDYLVQSGIIHYKLNYQQFSKCYRLSTTESIEIDFPSNWGPFSQISYSGYVSIKADENDEEMLCDILSEVVGEVKMLVITSENNSVLFVPLSTAFNEHAQWIQEYFEKKNQKSAA